MLAVVSAVCAGGASALTNGFSSAPSITSDKADYSPGETVTLTGYNWQAGEVVHISVNDDIGQTWSRDADVVAADDGSIRDQFQLPTSFISDYVVTATGPLSGTARTSFTDGNVKFDVAPTGATATFVETLYAGSATCGGVTKSGFPKTLTASDGDTVGVGNNESVRLDASATSDQGGAFSAWSSTDSPASPFTVIAGTGGKSICITGFQSGTREYRATYGAAPTNRAPTASAGGPYSGVEGASIQLDGSGSSDPDTGDTLTYAWTASPACALSSATTQKPTVTCNDNGSYTVSLTVTDDHGASSTAATATVTVTNGAPSAILGNTGPVNEGQSFQLSLSGATDPSSADTAAGFEYRFDCGDGSGYGAFASASAATCATADNATRSVKGEVRDKDGGVTEYTASVDVNNVAPSATFAAGGPVSEGQSFQLSLSGATDASSADTAAGFAYAFDCGDGSGYGSFSASAGTTCSTTDDGTRSVKGKVRDKDNDVSEYSGFVTVTNAPPTISAVANDGPVDEGGSATITVTASDPAGAADPLAYEFDCGGDGSYEVGPQGGNSHTCSFGDDGSRQVNVRVSDGDGGTATGSTAVTVKNVAPTISSVTNDGPIDEGGSAAITVTASDAADTITYEFDCNNDSTYEVGPQAGNTHACAFGDNGARQVNVRVADGDGGSTTGSTTVTVNNVAPTATFGDDGPVDEGTSFDLSLAGATDASAADTAAGFEYAFDCGNGSGYGAFAASNSATCSTTDQGTRAVKGKVKDKDGGVSEYTGSVTVRNLAPSVTAAADQTASEGTAKSVSLGSFADGGADSPWKVHVDWGDGSSSDLADKTSAGSLGSESHTYGDDGSYTVQVTVSDKDGGSGSATFGITVANVAPTAALGNTGPVEESSSVSVTFSSQNDPSAADTAAGFHYAYDCANGSLAGVTYATAGTTASTTCTYGDNGSYTVRGRIIDKDGGYSEYTTAVSVTNAKPALTPPSDDSGVEGTSKSFGLGSFDDAGANDGPWQLHVTWGDGSAATDLAFSARGVLGMSPHAYADNGTYTVTETITDKDGGSDTQTFKVEIANADPTATLGNDGPVDEGSAATVSFSGQSDPSSADTAAGFRYAYACDNGSLAAATYAGSGTAATKQCTFADDGTYPVRARIIDKDGGYTEYTTNVGVRNVAPNVTAAGAQSGDEGSSVSFALGSFADPGADSPWKIHVDWGDGTSSDLADKSSAGALGSASHTYSDDGSYTVEVEVTDKDGAAGTATFAVTVKNIAPSVTGPADQSSDEGSAASFDLGSFGDPGPDSPWKVHVDWGDGSSSDPSDKTSTGSLGSAAHTYADNGSFTAKVTVTDKDGGSGSATFKVTVANVAPTATLANNGPVLEGSAATISFSGDSDASPADTTAGFHYSYACNGDVGLLATTYAGATDGASKQCTFADNGSSTVKGRIFDKDGGSSTYETTVVVTNAKPSLSPPSDDSGVEGTSKSFGLGSFDDAGANDGPWQLHVTWGDGSAATDLSFSSRGTLGMAPHAYEDNGTYTVTETITDKDGGSDTQTFQITIANADPTATLGNNGPVQEGSPATVAFSAQADKSGADTTAGFHYAYACDNGSLAGATYAGSGTAATNECTFSDNGTHPVRGRIIDKDGGFSEYATNVVVTNVNPTVTAPADDSASEGASKSFSLGSFADPGPDSPWTVSVDWGDGTTSSPPNQMSTGSLGSAAHTYADNGVKTVTVKVTDKDGGVGQATFKITVANVPPRITSFTGTNALAGPLVFAPSAFTTVFTDPGADTWRANFGWADGSPLNQLVQPFVSGQIVQHQFASAGCAKTATVTVTDDDLGSDTATTTVQVGTGGFLPPMTNQPVTDKLRNGQVLPVKIQVTDCGGAGANGLSPAIRLTEGDQTALPDDGAVTIAVSSVSAADTTGVMRSNGSDGSYIYNMRVSVPKLNTDYTVMIYPYGNGQFTGPTLRHVIQATK